MRGPVWLDPATPARWNAAGAKVPPAPRSAPGALLTGPCTAQLRQPASAADRAVAAAGWRLLGASQRFGDTEVVGGQSGFDGMCRPTGYQFFVFSGGRFAGTVSPGPMDSRTDGAAQVPVLGSARDLAVTFSRYTPSDPLCCPSSLTTVRYRVDDQPRGPVLLPVGATTTRTGDPQAAAAAPAPDTGLCTPAPTAATCGPVPAAGGPSGPFLHRDAGMAPGPHPHDGWRGPRARSPGQVHARAGERRAGQPSVPTATGARPPT